MNIEEKKAACERHAVVFSHELLHNGMKYHRNGNIVTNLNPRKSPYIITHIVHTPLEYRLYGFKTGTIADYLNRAGQWTSLRIGD